MTYIVSGGELNSTHSLTTTVELTSSLGFFVNGAPETHGPNV